MPLSRARACVPARVAQPLLRASRFGSRCLPKRIAISFLCDRMWGTRDPRSVSLELEPAAPQRQQPRRGVLQYSLGSLDITSAEEEKECGALHQCASQGETRGTLRPASRRGCMHFVLVLRLLVF